jgi:ketosteroid isomerase-like protein
LEGVGLMADSEGVELARASVEAFNRGDLDWLLEHIDEDFVFDWSRSRGPLAGVYRGRAGLTEFCREQWETFETFHMEALEYIDCGRFVVVPNRVSARGRNGIEVSAEANQVFTLERDGRVSRVAMYQELEEAMAATMTTPSPSGEARRPPA